MKDAFLKYLPTACCIFFILFSLIHFLSERPLWMDEGYVLTILEKYSYNEFFQEFNPAVSFPRGYLALIKVTAAKFNNHLLALRLYPFLAMLTAFLLWCKIFRLALNDHEKWGMCLLSFASSYFMLYYAAELKPYSMDVLAVALYTLYLTKQGQFLPIKEFIFAALAPLLLFFSYGALFIFWMVPLNYVLLMRGSKKFVQPFVVSAIASLICFVLTYTLDIQNSITIAGVRYWDSYFLCVENWSCFGEPFGEGLKRLSVFWWSKEKIFTRAIIFFIPIFLYSMFRYGFTTFKKYKGTLMHISSIGFALLIELFILGLFKKYPFTGGRLTLFLAPFIMYFIILGLSDIRKIKYIGPVFWIYAYLYFGAASIYNAIHFTRLHF